MEVSEEWLETVLKRATLERSVARVISVEKENVVDKGDNYASDICRLKMETVLGSGRRATRTLIMKSMPATEHRAKHLREWGLFRKEIKMYNSLLPIIENLLETSGDTSERMWGQCLYTRSNDLLVLEDLKETGYKMADRKRGLDLNHAALVLRTLGKYHALTATLLANGMLDVGDYKNNIFSAKDENMGQYLDEILTVLADVIETTWGDEWKRYAAKFKSLVGKSQEVIGELFDEKKCKFLVLNHGDCWVNNMMFKYNSDPDTPSSIRFIDFQMAYHSSYAYDLCYFLTSSVRTELRDEDYGDLLAEYHRSLESNLRLFGYPGDDVPTLDDVVRELKSKSLFSLILVSVMLPYVFAEAEDAPDLEVVLKEYESTKIVRVDNRPMLGANFTRAAKSVLAMCHRNGVVE